MSNTLSATSVGIALSVILGVLFKFLNEKTALIVLAIQLGSIGGVYLGFSLAITEKERLHKNDKRNVWQMFDVQPTIETIFIVFIIYVATKAVQEESKAIMSFGYILHGLWDLLHHYVLDKTLVPSWYIPFCTVFDILYAVIIYFTL